MQMSTDWSLWGVSVWYTTPANGLKSVRANGLGHALIGSSPFPIKNFFFFACFTELATLTTGKKKCQWNRVDSFFFLFEMIKKWLGNVSTYSIQRVEGRNEITKSSKLMTLKVSKSLEMVMKTNQFSVDHIEAHQLANYLRRWVENHC